MDEMALSGNGGAVSQSVAGQSALGQSAPGKSVEARTLPQQ